MTLGLEDNLCFAGGPFSPATDDELLKLATAFRDEALRLGLELSA